MSCDAMIDIETFGTSPSAHIASIGVCWFNKDSDEIYGTSYWVMGSKHQNRSLDPKTVLWWMGQSEPARRELIHFSPKVGLEEALKQLRGEYQKYKARSVWANPPQFDLKILNNAYEQYKIGTPWHHRDEMDCRTIWKMVEQYSPFDGKELQREGTHHNALDDAVYQAKCLQSMLKKFSFQSK